MSITRRTLVRRGVGAGLTLVFYPVKPSKATSSPIFEPNAYLRITPDDSIVFCMTRSEMGQGVRTLLTTILAEELEVDPANVTLEQAMPGPRFKGIRLRTSGSGSSSGVYRTLRPAAAAAREMLLAAAAEIWQVETSACRAEQGSIVHDASGSRLRYGALTAAASRQPVPANPPLKPASQFRLLGKRQKRVDAAAIVHGRAQYGVDVRLPGMLVAAIARCPYLGGKVASFNKAQAMAIPGVRHVVQVHSGIFGGVGVVADHTWAAIQGRDALRIEWERGPQPEFDSEQFLQTLKVAGAGEGYPIRREGDWLGGLNGAANRMDAVYEYPFQAHAPLEPMNCTANVRRDSCEVWVPTQTPETAQQNVANALGLPPDAVHIHTTLLGGGFGRRLQVDYVDEAVELSKAVHKPVQVIWTRADDMRNGFFHPASVEQMSAGLSLDGIAAWVHRSIGSDLSLLGPKTAQERADPRHYAKQEMPWGAFDTFYNFAMRVDYVPVESPVPTGPWRAVMYPSRVFARESFLDEAAHALGRDPLDLRIALLAPGGKIKLESQEIDRARMIRVLEEARARCDWGKPWPGSTDRKRLRGRGLAINVYDTDSYMAQVAEVSLARDGSDLRVERMVCVFDCGMPLNPAGLEGQVESGIAWGLSAVLHGKINFKDGRAVESGYHDFRVIQMHEMPVIEPHIIPSTAAFGGFGEHPVAPVAPAVANAIFAATGKRIRKLPILPADLR
jgi:isoquinoline 1-oxidoreductase subunit beta